MIQVVEPGLLTTEGMENILNILNAGANAPPDSFKLKLYKEGWTHNQGSVYADFLANDCDFAGYADAVVTFVGPVVQAGPGRALVSINATFVATDGVTPNSVAGIVLVAVETAGPVNRTWAYWDFPTPVSVAVDGAFVGCKILLELPTLAGELVLET